MTATVTSINHRRQQRIAWHLMLAGVSPEVIAASTGMSLDEVRTIDCGDAP